MGATTFSGPIKAGTVREGADVNVGKVVLSQTNTVAYTDTTAKELFTLPANAQIVEVYVDVTTAFNDTGTDLLTVGTAADPDAFVDDADVSSAGRKLGSANATAAANMATVGTSDVAIQAVYTGANTDASAGAARVTVTYVQN